MAAPVRFTPAVETPEADEAKTERELTDTLLSISRTTCKDEQEALRAVHAKSHALLKARLTVAEGLHRDYAQGLFARPGSYDAVIRISSAPGDLLPDTVSTHHGFAIKVRGVEGPMLEGAEDGVQDFVLANGKAFNAPDAKHFLANLKLLAATTDKAEGLKVALSTALRGLETALERVGGQSAKLTALGGHPAYPVLGESFFSQVPYRYGDHIAKFGLFPVTDAQKAMADTLLDLHSDANAQRQAARAHLAAQGVAWELRVQLCIDLDTMPVEKPDVAWPEDVSSYVTVARLEAPPQEAYGDAMAAEVDRGAAFTPWNGLAAHQPLGAINRMRRGIYEASAGFRLGHNGCPFHAGGMMPSADAPA